MQPNDPIKLIYIVGSGHSGSTLLDLLLGSHSGIESGGEINKFPDFFSSKSKLSEHKKKCTCGDHVKDCKYWHRVNQKLTVESRNMGLKITAGDQREFSKANYLLYSAMLEVSGKTVLCDSSKQFSRLKRFLASDLFEVTIVHLVRDGRAIGYSKQRKAARKSDKLGTGEKGQNIYFQGLRMWKKNNARIYKKLSSYPRYLCIKYEDLVANPEAKLTEILANVDLKFEQQQLAFWQKVHHNLSGNRWRRRITPGAPQPIQRDVSYLKALPLYQWWMSNVFAFSELRRFGYSFNRE